MFKLSKINITFIKLRNLGNKITFTELLKEIGNYLRINCMFIYFIAAYGINFINFIGTPNLLHDFLIEIDSRNLKGTKII